ncbi:PREDICTED: nucleolar protein 12-like, partial [Rhagoletis zephyria]|uniref:nucleolar protein 12-like n=1 Tax=Rhagoletis zephyria TaxID=28612 RepID=UPI0008117BA7
HLGEYLFHEYHHYHRNERLYVKVERWKVTKSSCEDSNEEEKEDKEKEEKDEETEVAAEETKTDKDDDDDDDMELSESEKELKIQSLGALIARKEVELLELMQRKLKWFEENASELLDKIKAWEEANQDNIDNNSDNDNTEEQQQQQSSQP